METASATILQVDAASLRYDAGEEVLRDVGLSLAAGSFHFLVGDSGTGKTSLLRLLALSHPPCRGVVTLFGRDTGRLDRTELAAVRRRIGVVFQDFRLLDHLSVFDNVALPLRIGGADDERIAGHVADLLGWLGLGALLEVLPSRLSMGQRQLVAAARAVVTRPSLLLADEPTSNVDPTRARQLLHLFTSLHKLGTTVVLATHSREVLNRYAFPVIEMHDGRPYVPAAFRLAAAMAAE